MQDYRKCSTSALAHINKFTHHPCCIAGILSKNSTLFFGKKNWHKRSSYVLLCSPHKSDEQKKTQEHLFFFPFLCDELIHGDSRGCTSETAGVELLHFYIFSTNNREEAACQRRKKAPVLTVGNTAVSPFCTTNAQITEQRRKQVLSYSQRCNNWK